MEFDTIVFDWPILVTILLYYTTIVTIAIEEPIGVPSKGS